MSATPIPSPTTNMLSETFHEVAQSTGLNKFLSNFTGFTWERLIFVAILIGCGLIFIKIIQRLINRVLSRGRIEPSLHSFIRTTANVLLYFLFVLIVASSPNIDVTSLVAVLSVAGLAVSLAVQGSLSNLAGGIQVLAAKPFKVGDFIETNSVSGTVREIGMSHTKLQTVDNKVIYVPNSEIAAAKIINYSAEARRRVDLTVSASYDDKTEDVIRAIRGVIDAHPKALREPEPFVRLSAYGDSCIEYTVRVWCETADYWDLYFDLLEQLRGAFDRSGITMTYPHLNVHMVEK